MKILCVGDIHARIQSPRNRVDENYLGTFLRKLNFIAYTVNAESIDLVFVPGDIFDSYRASNFLERVVIKALKKWGVPIWGVTGQHDQRHHRIDWRNTPVGVLEAAGVYKVLGDVPEKPPHELIDVYGASLGQDIPKVADPNTRNVLVTHRMIIHKRRLWLGQTNFDMAGKLLKKGDFDLIVSGDNHNFFTEEYSGRFLINCGSLVRNNIDQIDHKPAIVVFDTETWDGEVIEIPIDPSKEVFRLVAVEEEKEESEQLKEFTDALDDDEENEELDFLKNLRSYEKKNEIEEGVRQEVWEAVG